MSEALVNSALNAEKVKESPEKAVPPPVTQSNYRPTPYKPTQWEVIGERITDDEFSGMSLEVIRTYHSMGDPMFEQFGEESQFSGLTEWESPGSSKREKGQEEQSENDVIKLEVFEAELKKSFEEGRQAGYQQGLTEQNNAAQAQHKALSVKLTQFAASIKQELNKHREQLEHKALDLAIGISKKIIDTTAEVKPEYIFDVIRKGLKSLGAAKPLRVRVSAQDYEFLEVIGMPADITPTELGVVYVADETIKSGCVVETDFGEVNLELDEMWEQVKDSLYAVKS